MDEDDEDVDGAWMGENGLMCDGACMWLDALGGRDGAVNESAS